MFLHLAVYTLLRFLGSFVRSDVGLYLAVISFFIAAEVPGNQVVDREITALFIAWLVLNISQHPCSRCRILIHFSDTVLILTGGLLGRQSQLVERKTSSHAGRHLGLLLLADAAFRDDIILSE